MLRRPGFRPNAQVAELFRHAAFTPALLDGGIYSLRERCQPLSDFGLLRAPQSGCALPKTKSSNQIIQGRIPEARALCHAALRAPPEILQLEKAVLRLHEAEGVKRCL